MAKTSFNDLIKSDIPVLIDFYADWCGPCRMVTPIIKELKSEYGDRIRVVKIDVDKNQPLAGKLQVSSIPTLMIYQNGDMKWRVAGVQTAAAIKKHLEPLLN